MRQSYLLIANSNPNIEDVGALLSEQLNAYQIDVQADGIYIASFQGTSDICIEYLNLKIVTADESQWLIHNWHSDAELREDFTLLYCWYTVAAVSNRIFPVIAEAFIRNGWDTYVGIQGRLRFPGSVFLSHLNHSPEWRWDFQPLPPLPKT